MNELERYQRAVGAAQAALRDVQNMAPTGALIHLAQETLKYVDDILNPPPVYENVEITRWECDKCGIVTRGATPTDECEVCHAFSFTLLTGLRRVEKPQPRERSVSVEAQVNGAGYVTAKADDGRFTRIAFYDYPECHGKQVTLTATWQE